MTLFSETIVAPFGVGSNVEVLVSDDGDWITIKSGALEGSARMSFALAIVFYAALERAITAAAEFHARDVA